MIPFLLLGFLITAYSGLSITGIAAFACIVAFVMAQVNFGRKNLILRFKANLIH